MKNEILFSFVNFLVLVQLTDSFLDLDELHSVQYGIDIVGKPVVMGQVSKLQRSSFACFGPSAAGTP